MKDNFMEAQKAAFMGKMTAGVTHEIKNVLAIVKESAGLMEDLLLLTKNDSEIPREKFLTTLNRIAQQVNRGTVLASELNTFAHTSDLESASVNIGAMIKQTVFLCQRFARLKSLTLDALPVEKDFSVTTDPMALQMLLFHCVDAVMNSVQPENCITVEVDSLRNCIIIAASQSKDESNASELNGLIERIRPIAVGLNIKLESGTAPARVSLLF